MSGRNPLGQPPCDRSRSCIRLHGHDGDCVQKPCARQGCSNPTRNVDETYCVRHESRATYERYRWAATDD